MTSSSSKRTRNDLMLGVSCMMSITVAISGR